MLKKLIAGIASVTLALGMVALTGGPASAANEPTHLVSATCTAVTVDLVEPGSLVGAQGRQALHLHEVAQVAEIHQRSPLQGHRQVLDGSGEWSQLHETEV